jgi:hypothetical protein
MPGIMLPIVFFGLLTRSMNKRISQMLSQVKHQDEIDYIFATMVNNLDLTENENDTKTNI